MSTQMKLIVPLLDNCITKEDLTPESGFVDAYVFDKNRPYIEDCIFLMYDISKPTKETGKHEHRFHNCTNLHSIKVVNIGGKPYKIFAFKMIGKDVKDLYKGFKPKDYNNVVHILSFWRGYDEDVNKAMLINKPERLSCDWKTIPEYDYLPGPQMGFGKKEGGTLAKEPRLY